MTNPAILKKNSMENWERTEGIMHETAERKGKAEQLAPCGQGYDSACCIDKLKYTLHNMHISSCCQH